MVGLTHPVSMMYRVLRAPILGALCVIVAAGLLFAGAAPVVVGQAGALRFAVIGDYGFADDPEAEVAAMVRSWKPDLVITVGDNNYPLGEASTIDENIGQFYHDFISPYKGTYGLGADTNRFFPSLGNHDWETAGAAPYLDYFTLPGNERYYDFVRGPVHFFAIDSDGREPDGRDVGSKQAAWLKQKMGKAVETWRIVYFHEAAYSSGEHGSTAVMQWPYGEWSATGVMAGHDHIYERILLDGMPYFVNGAGGNRLYDFHSVVEGSRARYNKDQGAMLVEATDRTIVYSFVNRKGVTIDQFAQCAPEVDGPTVWTCLPGIWGGRSR